MGPPNNRMKSRVPKMTTQTLLDFDLGESSSDSDFRIEDHAESDDDFSDGSKDKESNQGGDGNSNSSSDDDDDDSSGDGSESSCSDLKHLFEDAELKPPKVETKIKDALTKVITSASLKDKLPTKPICCVCLGDRSDDTNEVIECDSCGVSVHEGCYGVSDTASVSSTTSSCSTEPWFCEACRAGVTNPSCELCPNKGGIFKETDVGKWVHLVCALYVPGVAFGEVDQLSSVTLFEMQYSKWGAKTCTLCENERFSRTGVCIGCDAGMCKTFFHVTCAQAAGFLSEAHSEEADHADPFYAHCKVHSDKTMIKHRKRHFNSIKLVMEHKNLEKQEHKNDNPTPGQVRIQRKLAKYQNKYRNNKHLKIEPWVPTQKISRLLTTSATACNRLLMKAEIMDVDIAALELQEAQISALTDIRKKWHIAPAFSVEFIGYYLDRISRIKELKGNLEQMIDANTNLLGDQQSLRDEYDLKVKSNADLKSKHEALQASVREMHKQIESLCPSKTMPTLENIGRQVAAPSPIVTPPSRPMSVPTAAALKMGVGFPLAHLPGIKDDTGRVLSTQSQNKTALVHECGICKRCNDQHLLAKCDTCHFHYHLGCLNPPLTRHPKKSKLYGWQCSECDKSEDSDAVPDMPKGPRKSRTRFSKDGTIVPADPNLSSSNPETSMSPKSISPVKRRSTDTSIRMGPKRSSLEFTQNGKSLASLPAPKPLRKSLDAPKKIEDTINAAKRPRSKIIDYSPLITHNPQVVLEDALKSVSVKKFASISNFPEFSEAVSEAQKNSAKEDPLATTSEDAKLLSKGALDLSSVQALTTSQSTSASALTSLDSSIGFETGKEFHNKNRKKRSKDKHKSKYSSDNEKSPSKEHKRKRKKKNHDNENPNDNEPAIPKIKIKFKTLPLPGEVAPEAHFFYVSADMVRSRPTSVETVEDLTLNADDNSQNNISASPEVVKSSPEVTKTPVKTPSKIAQSLTSSTKVVPPPAVRQVSPRKANKRTSLSLSSSSSSQHPPKDVICDVCKESGTPQNLVFCDECRKNYHFTCLDPPLKKTPKRRGYSWHCADCDPTDVETT
ncbi:PHD finger protein 14 [Eupeodes corollae]|uniref:PHD finger protein 14 n=1 Tax=Eupeodes corollae TaxID=290404 RepID=UPI00249249F4|nr:PHD finger protein 14 [Eupeodes corollae]